MKRKGRSGYGYATHIKPQGYTSRPPLLTTNKVFVLSSGVQQYSIMSAQRSRNPTIINFRFTGVQDQKDLIRLLGAALSVVL
jgi:hypothetical protein